MGNGSPVGQTTGWYESGTWNELPNSTAYGAMRDPYRVLLCPLTVSSLPVGLGTSLSASGMRRAVNQYAAWSATASQSQASPSHLTLSASPLDPMTGQ